jgi:flagella basal body P-ring formation protein FlgA
MMLRAILIMMLFMSSAAFGATSVTLRASAVAAPGEVALGDVASVEGDDAARLRGVVVASEWPSSGEVTLRDVREALDEAGVNWGRVTLRGGTCRLRAGEPRLASVAPQPSEREAPKPGVVKLDGPPSVRIKIAKVLGELYGVANEDLRLLFDDRDADILGPMAPGRRYEVVANSGASSERAPVTVTVFEGSRLVESRSVRADVQVRTSTLTLRRDVSRGERIEADALSAGERWISPAGSPVVASAEEAAGMLARTRLSAGTVLRESVLERPVLIRRNELATVHCLSGSVSLRVEARAMSDGRAGDVIEFRTSRDTEPFRARVSGAGIAVATSEMENES